MFAFFGANTIMELEPNVGDWTEHIDRLRKALRDAPLVERGRVHAQDVSSDPSFGTYELANIVVTYPVPTYVRSLQAHMSPNLPWAEDHFAERVGGEPLNPAPSEAWWPYKKDGNAAHKDGEKFSHTYPERMWPTTANTGWMWDNDNGSTPVMELESSGQGWVWKGTDTVVDFQAVGYKRARRHGIRYDYGDLNAVVDLLSRDIHTRQAYLPIWFPEDTGAIEGQRVPCSLGYHFIKRGNQIDCQYFMRSCDFFRHYVDDAYMAARLLQWVVRHTRESNPQLVRDGLSTGNLTMFISNLHAFVGDEYLLNGE
jgi:hypothetical protein